MTGAEIDRRTFIRSEYKNIDDKSIKLLDEIIALFLQLKPMKWVFHDETKYWHIWLKEPRGSYSKFIRENKNHRDEYTKEEFYERYPKKDCWFELCLIYEENRYKFLALNDFRIILNKNEFDKVDSYQFDLTPILLWIKQKVISVIDELKQGTYNDRIERELPYTLRYGVLKRKTYWDIATEEKKKILGGLTQDDINEFINLVETEGYDYIPKERIKEMTFSKYFQLAYYGYDYAKLTVDGATPEKLFLARGEDFGGSIFNDIDFYSAEDFDAYYEGQLGYYGGHPWGMLRGTSRTRIMLHPVYGCDGYYFWLGGNPTYMIFEIVRFYLGLKRNNVPVRLSNAKACVDYLREEDLVGFVKETEMAIYCSDKFPDHDVNDFRHLHEEKYPQLKELIEWLPLEKVELVDV